MEVRIENLPEDIQETLYQRAKEQGKDILPTDKMTVIHWHKTPEGYDYWEKVLIENRTRLQVEHDKGKSKVQENQTVNKNLTKKPVIEYEKDGWIENEYEEKHKVEQDAAPVIKYHENLYGNISNIFNGCHTPELIEMENVVKFMDETIMGSVTKHEGKRFNTGKTRFDLVHPAAHEGMVEVLTLGAQKYGENNWEKGMAWSTVIASLKRHLNAFEKGEDYDPETGKLHIDHIACNVHFISAYYRIYPQGDDRRHNYLRTTKIGLDIDEVLCDWIGDWVTLRGMPHPNSWYFDRGMADAFDRMKAEGKLDEFYMNLQPRMKPEDIPFEPYCYITSRPVDSAVTEAWLAKHGFPAVPVYTTGVNGSKVEIALREKLDIFVDDGFHNFRDLNNAGVACFLMDAPHNQRYSVGYRRIKNLNELKF